MAGENPMDQRIEAFLADVLSYGVDYIDVGRRAASYVDRSIRANAAQCRA
jgi:hypothetical protein